MVNFTFYEGRMQGVVCNSVNNNNISKEKPSKHKGWRKRFESLSISNRFNGYP